MKKFLAITLAAMMVAFALGACGGDSSVSPTPTPAASNGGGGDDSTPTPAPADNGGKSVEVEIMLIKNGDNSDEEIAQVQTAINERLAAIGLNITAKLRFTAWDMQAQSQEMSTGASTVDIFPSGIGDSAIDFVLGAQQGQYIRLDDGPDGNLLETYGKGLFENAPAGVRSVATVNGVEGMGVYAYVVPKDINAQLGYLVNTVELDALGFKVSDIKPNDISSLEPILKAYKEKYPDRYPLNAEPEVLARAATKTTYLDSTTGPLGYEFSDAGHATVVSRYETAAYKKFLENMRNFNAAKYVDPDQSVAATAPASYLKRLGADTIDWIICSAPSAGTAGQVADKEASITFIPAYNIMTNESVGAAALSVYSGTDCAKEAVQLLNAIVTDKELADLFSAGVKDTCYAVTDNGSLDVLTNTFRWWPWRYGVVGQNSAATPWSAFGTDGGNDEWDLMKAANSGATPLDSVGFIFDRTNVENELVGVTNAISTYAIQLGSGAGTAADYEAFISEIQTAGIQKVMDETKNQYEAWQASK